MEEEGDPGHEPVFRANKRRKVFRKRTDPDDKITSDPSLSDIPTDNSENQSIPSAPTRPQKTGQIRKYGISFTSAATKVPTPSEDQHEEMALVRMHPSREQQIVQSDRFVKPTGKVAVADDKHMVAFIDSKLAELRSSTVTPITQIGSGTEPRSSNSAVQSGETSTEAQSQSEGVDAQNFNAVTTAASSTTAAQNDKANRRPNPRPRRPLLARDESAVARESLVDQILRESVVPLYDHSTTGTTYAANEGMSNDEAVANAFKEEFLAQAELHKRRKTPAPPPQKGAAPVSNGPKLGGSRSQREKMKAAEEAAKASGGGKR